MLKLDREKYLSILNTKGLSAALTALHHDQTVMEHETFEGRDGYQPANWTVMNQVHDFSRELWDLARDPRYAPRS